MKLYKNSELSHYFLSSCLIAIKFLNSRINMEITEKLYLKNRDEWREWLQEHHQTKKEIWLIFFKKHTGKPGIPYDDSVEEALCFGWIDSIIKKIDEEKYSRKFTPRKKNSNWSALNITRAKKMINEGKMTDAGLVLYKEMEKDKKRIVQQKLPEKELTIPDYLKEALAINKKAQLNFDNFAFSYKRNYVGWITSAKKEETRKRRINEAVELIEQNIKNLMR